MCGGCSTDLMPRALVQATRKAERAENRAEKRARDRAAERETEILADTPTVDVSAPEVQKLAMAALLLAHDWLAAHGAESVEELQECMSTCTELAAAEISVPEKPTVEAPVAAVADKPLKLAKKRPIPPRDRFKQALLDKDPIAVAINRIVRSVGWYIALPGNPNIVGYKVRAIEALEDIYAISPALLLRTLQMLKAIWGDRLQSARCCWVMRAMAMLLNEQPELCDDPPSRTLFIRTLRRIAPMAPYKPAVAKRGDVVTNMSKAYALAYTAALAAPLAPVDSEA